MKNLDHKVRSVLWEFYTSAVYAELEESLMTYVNLYPSLSKSVSQHM